MSACLFKNDPENISEYIQEKSNKRKSGNRERQSRYRLKKKSQLALKNK